MSNRFNILYQHVCEMSKEQAEARFFEVERSHILNHFEQGAILSQARNSWFTGEKEKARAGYESWVLSSLRTPLDKADRLLKTFKAVRASGLMEDDFNGIPFSSIRVMLSVVRNEQFKEEVPGLLQFAKEHTFREVKARCNEIRGLKTLLPDNSTVGVFKRADWLTCQEILKGIAKAAHERDMQFAYVLIDSDGRKHHFTTTALAKYWRPAIDLLNEQMREDAAFELASTAPETEVVAYVEPSAPAVEIEATVGAPSMEAASPQDV